MMNSSHSVARSAIFASIRENLAKSKPFDSDHREVPLLKAGVAADSADLMVLEGGARESDDDSTTAALSPPEGGAAGETPAFQSVDVAREASVIANTLAVRASNELLGEFQESLEQVGAKCTFVTDESEAADRLRSIVNDLSAKEVMVSDSEVVHRIVNAAELDAIADASRDELFSSDVGITSAQWAIAETGTLVLESGAERHRLVSLVPPVHVCIVRTSSIRQSMAEILALADTDTNPTITFITGASRTSDIELTLAIGVHGPGELHVIVIKDQ